MLTFRKLADDCVGSASFGTNPFEWFRAAVTPGLRQERSRREIDTAKQTKAEGESQSVFDTVSPEEGKAQQKDSTPSVGMPRQSDHVREYPLLSVIRTPPTHSIKNYCVAQILYGKFQNLT